MEDPMLYQFLEILLPLLTNKDCLLTSYADLQYSISNIGLITVNYDGFLKDHVDLSMYLKKNSKKSTVKSFFCACQINFFGKGNHRTMEINVDALAYVKDILSKPPPTSSPASKPLQSNTFVPSSASQLHLLAMTPSTLLPSILVDKYSSGSL